MSVMEKELKTYLEGMEERLTTVVKSEVQAAETRTDAKLDALTSTMNDVVGLVEKRFDSLDEHLAPLTNQVSGHEKRLKFLEDRLPKLA
jgi:chaperonin cofactor prefoldin